MTIINIIDVNLQNGETALSLARRSRWGRNQNLVQYLEYASTPQFMRDVRWNRRKAYMMVIYQIQKMRNTQATIEALHIYDIHRLIGTYL